MEGVVRNETRTDRLGAHDGERQLDSWGMCTDCSRFLLMQLSQNDSGWEAGSHVLQTVRLTSLLGVHMDPWPLGALSLPLLTTHGS